LPIPPQKIQLFPQIPHPNFFNPIFVPIDIINLSFLMVVGCDSNP
jgi:hypothetical protein